MAGAEVVLLVDLAGGVLVGFLPRELEVAGGRPCVDDCRGHGGVWVVAFGWWGDAGQAEGMGVWVGKGAGGGVLFLEWVGGGGGGG